MSASYAQVRADRSVEDDLSYTPQIADQCLEEDERHLGDEPEKERELPCRRGEGALEPIWTIIATNDLVVVGHHMAMSIEWQGLRAPPVRIVRAVLSSSMSCLITLPRVITSSRYSCSLIQLCCSSIRGRLDSQL